MAEAEKKGQLHRYEECSDFLVEFGKHKGKPLKSLPRHAAFGFAFLQRTQAQCEQELRYLDALLNDLPEEEQLREEAEAYCIKVGRRKARSLGSMRPETWRRLRLLIESDLGRIELIERVRKVAQDFLRYSPPGFPRLRSGVLSSRRRQELVAEYQEALDDYGSLPDIGDEEAVMASLAANERELFRDLQQRAFAATSQPKYVTLQWDRADGAVKSRDIALLYESSAGRYLLMAHILHTESRHRRPLRVRGNLFDVNNPDIRLVSRERPSIANLYELEFSVHQLKLLDRARREAGLWKGKGRYSGAIRTGKLQAHYDEERDEWWFETLLSVGYKPAQYKSPERVVGIHIEPYRGWFISILNLDGTLIEDFQLDEQCIAHLLKNRDPEQQARLRPTKRTAKERSHRYADAIVEICRQHQALCSFENISYRRAEPGPNQLIGTQDNSRMVFEYLKYKLPLAELPPPLDMKGVAPRRDCGHCGHRHQDATVEAKIFRCHSCGHSMQASTNTAREVARRTLWTLAARKPRRQKKAGTTKTDKGLPKAI